VFFLLLHRRKRRGTITSSTSSVPQPPCLSSRAWVSVSAPTSPAAQLAGQRQPFPPCPATSWVLEEALLLLGTPGGGEGGREAGGAGCAGSQPAASPSQVGQSPSTTPARASAPLPRAPTTQPTSTARGTPSRSSVLSWLGTGWRAGRASPQGWLSHRPHPDAGAGVLVPHIPVLGSRAICWPFPSLQRVGCRGSEQHGVGEPGDPLMPVLCPQASPRPTSWSCSASWLPSCTWATSWSEGGTAVGTAASWRWARACCLRPASQSGP